MGMKDERREMSDTCLMIAPSVLLNMGVLASRQRSSGSYTRVSQTPPPRASQEP